MIASVPKKLSLPTLFLARIVIVSVAGTGRQERVRPAGRRTRLRQQRGRGRELDHLTRVEVCVWMHTHRHALSVVVSC